MAGRLGLDPSVQPDGQEDEDFDSFFQKAVEGQKHEYVAPQERKEYFNQIGLGQFDGDNDLKLELYDAPRSRIEEVLKERQSNNNRNLAKPKASLFSSPVIDLDLAKRGFASTSVGKFFQSDPEPGQPPEDPMALTPLGPSPTPKPVAPPTQTDPPEMPEVDATPDEFKQPPKPTPQVKTRMLGTPPEDKQASLMPFDRPAPPAQSKPTSTPLSQASYASPLSAFTETIMDDEKRTSFIDDLKQAGSSVMQGLAQVPSGLFKSIGIAAKTIDDQLPAWMQQHGEQKTEEMATYRIGQAIQTAASEAFPTDPDRQKEFLATVLPQAIGSMLGFMATGGAAGALGGSRMAGTVLFGAGAQAPQGFEEAQAAGPQPNTETPYSLTDVFSPLGAAAKHLGESSADPERNARKAFLLGLGIGATEAIPIERAIHRIDEASGGGLSKVIKSHGIAGAEEWVQEFFQQSAGNAVAQQLYDQDRNLFEGSFDSAAAGGVAGFMMSVVQGMLRLKGGGLGYEDQPTPGAPPPIDEGGPSIDPTQAALPSATVASEGPPSPLPEDLTIPEVATLPSALDALAPEVQGPPQAEELQVEGPITEDQILQALGASFPQETQPKLLKRQKEGAIDVIPEPPLPEQPIPEPPPLEAAKPLGKRAQAQADAEQKASLASLYDSFRYADAMDDQETMQQVADQLRAQGKDLPDPEQFQQWAEVRDTLNAAKNSLGVAGKERGFKSLVEVSGQGGTKEVAASKSPTDMWFKQLTTKPADSKYLVEGQKAWNAEKIDRTLQEGLSLLPGEEPSANLQILLDAIQADPKYSQLLVAEPDAPWQGKLFNDDLNQVDLFADEQTDHEPAPKEDVAQMEAEKPTKEPWEMTQDEWMDMPATEMPTGVGGRARERIALGRHGEAVKQALAEGKPVPEPVLADYPDLQPKAQEKTPIIEPGQPDDFALTPLAQQKQKAKAKDAQPELFGTGETLEAGTSPIIGRDVTPEEAPLFSKTAQEAQPEQSLMPFESSDEPADPISLMPEGVAPSRQLRDAGEKIGGARKDLAVKTGPKVKKEVSEDPGWKRRYEVSEIVKSRRPGEEGKWTIADTKKKNFMGQPERVGNKFFDTKEEAEAAVPLAAVSRNHRAVPIKDGKYEIWRDVTDRKRLKIVDQTFDSREDAMRYMAEHAEAIIETKTSFGEEILPVPDTVVRKGKDYRQGKNVEPEAVRKDFGLRAVEFGNWESQDERQHVVNHAYDGLQDLADILEIPPEAIGLNGDLGLAFGARGHGLSGARAHYERDYGVMNLTKMQGAGSLAHEWFHAADHYFGRQDTKASSKKIENERGDQVFQSKGREQDYASHGFRATGSEVREEVRQAYNDLINTMFKKGQQYVEDTQQADKFVATTKDRVSDSLAAIRKDLAETKDPRYSKRKNLAASAEQLATFDDLANKITEGELLTTEYRVVDEKKQKQRSFSLAGSRWTNDALEQLSAIYKDVRGRSGFGSVEQRGIFDNLRTDMNLYSARLKMLADAQSGETKTKKVPTQFAMDAKSIDQGRASDYWTTNHEMAARAFQAYVEDKIAEKGGQSDFLSYGTHRSVPTPWGWVKPYPHGEERTAINQAFDKLFRTLQTKETEKGVALFEREGANEPRISESEGRDSGVRREAGRADQAKLSRRDEGREPVRERPDSGRPESRRAVSPLREGGGVTTLAKRLTKDLKRVGKLDLRGADVRNVWELAELAQIYRSPQYETLRVWYVKDGKVVGHEGMTSRLPNVVAFAKDLSTIQDYLDRIEFLKGRFKADGYYLQHNHPSGNPSPSEEDITMTVLVQQQVPGFKGHVIINHTKFAVIDVMEGINMTPLPGKAEVGVETYELPNVNFRENPHKPHPFLGANVTDYRMMAEMGKRIQSPKGYTTVIYRGAKGRVEAIQEVPDNMVRSDDFVGYIRNATRDFGAVTAFTYSNSTDADLELRTMELVEKGVLKDALTDGKEGIRLATEFVLPMSEKTNLSQGIKAPEAFKRTHKVMEEDAPWEGKTPMTETAAFKEWFKNSKVVDEDGSPMVVYHGTTSAFGYFDFSNGLPYFTNKPDQASMFSHAKSIKSGNEEGGSNVMPVYLSIKTPLRPSILAGFGGNIEMAKAAGHDGEIDKLNSGEIRYRPFSSNQIKSIYNQSTFDPKDPNILKEDDAPYEGRPSKPSAAAFADLDRQDQQITRTEVKAGSQPPAGQPPRGIPPTPAYTGFDVPSESTFERIRRYVQDRFRRLAVTQEAITDQIGPIAEEHDTYLHTELFPGKVEPQIVELEREHFRPLVQAMHDAKVGKDDLDKFLYAKHAAERNAHVASINDKMPDGGSGMSNQEAKDILVAVFNKGQTATMDALAKRVYAINQKRLDTLVDGGLITAGERQVLNDTYDFYVPLKGAPGEQAPSRPRTGKGFDIRGKEHKRALGRKSEAHSILEHIWAQADEAIIRAEKNLVGQAFLKMAEQYPHKEMWTINPVKFRRYLDQRTGEVKSGKDPLTKLADNVMSVKIDGKEQYIEMHDEALAQAMKNLGAERSGMILKALQAINRYLALVNTALNPEFVLSNLQRDLQTASINLTGEQGLTFATQVMRGVPGAIRGGYGYIANRDTSTEWGKWFKEYEEVGGRIGFFGLEDIEVKRGRLNALVGRLENTPKAKAMALANGLHDLIFDLNGAVENASRISAYRYARTTLGLSKKKAASLSRNLTVDFNKKGILGNVLNGMYLFFNANLQGSARLARALTNKRVQKIVGGAVAGAFLHAELNRWLAGIDPDDDENYFSKLEEYIQESFIPFYYGAEDGSFVKWQLPYGYNTFYWFGQALNRVAHGDMTPGAFLSGFVRTLLGAFNPLGSDDSLLKNAVPTFARWWVDLELNTNFFGGPIMPEQFPFQAPKPDSERYFRSVSASSKAIAQSVNRLTGGSQWRPGWADVSPETLDYMVQYVTGGTGATILRAGSLPVKLMKETPVEANEVPLVRKFFGTPSSWEATERWKLEADDVQTTLTQQKGLKATDPGAALDFAVDAAPMLRLERHMKVAEKALSYLGDLRDKAVMLEDEVEVEAIRDASERVQKWFHRSYQQAKDGEVVSPLPYNKKSNNYKIQGERLAKRMRVMSARPPAGNATKQQPPGQKVQRDARADFKESAQGDPFLDVVGMRD